MTDRVFVPLLVAVVGFFIGFVLIAPLRCTVTESVLEGAHRSGGDTVHGGSTSCSSVAGVEYTGEGDYSPPRTLGVLAGVAVAAALAAATSVLQRGRPPERMRPQAIGWIGVGMHAAWTVFLAGLALFSDGALDPQWRTALLFVCLAVLPAVVASFGLRGRPALLLTAGVLCLPLSFLSLAGATLPLLLPACLYLASYARS